MGRISSAKRLPGVRQTIDAVNRRLVARRVTAQLAVFRRDKAAWQAYLDKGDATSVRDGID